MCTLQLKFACIKWSSAHLGQPSFDDYTLKKRAMLKFNETREKNGLNELHHYFLALNPCWSTAQRARFFSVNFIVQLHLFVSMFSHFLCDVKKRLGTSISICLHMSTFSLKLVSMNAVQTYTYTHTKPHTLPVYCCYKTIHFLWINERGPYFFPPSSSSLSVGK